MKEIKELNSVSPNISHYTINLKTTLTFYHTYSTQIEAKFN